MSIDTEIEGSPGQVEGAAEWLRNQLASRLGSAADRLNDARKDADGSWNSVAGDEFVDLMTRARDETDDLQSAARRMGQDLEDFASRLRTCQEQMADVRTGARASGLGVSGFVVEDPGPGPARPPDHFEGTPEQVRDHDQRVDAYNAHQRLVEAYNQAHREAARIDRQYAAACRALQHDYTVREHAAWVVTLGDILGDAAAAAIGVHLGLRKSGLHGRAQSLLDEASRAIDDLQAHPERYLKRTWFFFKELDATRLEADRLVIAGKLDEASELLDEAARLDDARLPKYLGRAGRVLGPAGVALGVYNDYQDGETATQVAASQGMSLAAGVGSGALAGAAIGSVVPVVGTAAGAAVGTVVGAGVAIFTDGAIDSVFENGPDVGKAFEEGVDALESTGEAIADGVTSAAEAVGGWFS